MSILLIALFGAMVVVALWGWLTASRGRRFPVRMGAPPSFDATLGKTTGLIVWVVLGAVVLAGSLMVDADNRGLALAGAGLLVFLLVMEVASVRRLTR